MPVLERRGPHCSARERPAAVRSTDPGRGVPGSGPVRPNPPDARGRPVTRSLRFGLLAVAALLFFGSSSVVELYTDWLWFGGGRTPTGVPDHARRSGVAGERGVRGVGDLAGVQPATGRLESSFRRAASLGWTGRSDSVAEPRDTSAAAVRRRGAPGDSGGLDRIQSVDDVACLPVRRPLQHRRPCARTRHRVLHLHAALSRSRPRRCDGAGRRRGGDQRSRVRA